MAKPGPVLIVEDDKKTASLISLYLKHEGYETAVAFDGVEALDWSGRKIPVVVILDLMLRRLDGWEVCRKIREFSRCSYPDANGKGEEFDRVLGLTIGADDYMVKPFSPVSLSPDQGSIDDEATSSAGERSDTLKVGTLMLDSHKHEVTVDNRRILSSLHRNSSCFDCS